MKNRFGQISILQRFDDLISDITSGYGLNKDKAVKKVLKKIIDGNMHDTFRGMPGSYYNLKILKIDVAGKIEPKLLVKEKKA